MILSRDKGKRMWGGGGSGGSGGGGGLDPSALAGYATMGWVDENYLSKAFWNELFIIHKKVTTVVMNGQTEISRTVDTSGTFAPNEIPETTSTTDETTGYVTTVTTEVDSIEARKGIWTNYYVSALGQNAGGGGGGGGGGGASTLHDLLDVNIPASMTQANNGQVLMYNFASNRWVNADLPLSGYATQSWVQQQGYVTQSALSDYATQTWVTNNFLGINGTAAKATKLATARTLWGQSFDGSANVTGTITVGAGNIVMNNARNIVFKDAPAEGATATEREVIRLTSNNNMYLCRGTAAAGYNTYLYGNSIAFRYGTSGTTGMYINSSGNVGIGTTSPTMKLDVNGYAKTTRLYLYDDVYLEYDSTNGGVHLVGAGFYSDSYVSALGANSSGSGGGGASTLGDLLDVTLSSLSDGQVLMYRNNMWVNASLTDYATKTWVQQQAYLTASALNGYATENWVGQNYLDKNATAVAATKLATARTLWGQSFDGTANVTGTITVGAGNIVMNNNEHIYFKDAPAAGATATNRDVLRLSSSNNLLIGYGTSAAGYYTHLYGNIIAFRYGTSRTVGMTLDSSGNLGIGTTSPTMKLDVNGYAKTTRLYLSADVYLEYDSTNGGVHVVGAGLYSDSYISALGANSSGSGGGASTLNDLLDTDITSPSNGQVLTYRNGMWVNDDPPTPSLSGYATESWVQQNFASKSDITDMATRTWVNQQGFALSSALSGYLPLAGGEMTGTLWFNGNVGIKFKQTVSGATTNAGMLIWKPTSGWTGVTSTQWGVGDTLTQGVIRSNNMDLIHWKNGASGTGENGYVIYDASNIHTANAGSAMKLQTARTLWGQSFDGTANVDGDIEAGSNGGIITGFDTISLNTIGTATTNTGGMIDFHYNGYGTEYTTRLVESGIGILSIDAKNYMPPYDDKLAGLRIGAGKNGSFIQIGDIRIVYDSANNALKVVKSDGTTAANFYATGGVSALGSS